MPNTIYHSGIPGQKWGLRRYQNHDGTYTEEGKARRRKTDNYSEDYKRYKQLKRKSVKEMSNKELIDFNNRANLEAQYKRNIETGKSFTKTVYNKVFEKTAEAAAVAIVTAIISNLKKTK